MSRNLVELIRRHHAVDAPTALEVLKQAMDDHGELTDADRKRAAEVSGLPEAAVYGVSTFYDDLLAPRGERHVRVCTGTACFAAARETTVERVGEGLGIGPGERSADGSVSMAETVCLGFCHSSPAIRVGDTVDAGPGVAEAGNHHRELLFHLVEGLRIDAVGELYVHPVFVDAWSGVAGRGGAVSSNCRPGRGGRGTRGS